MKKIIVLNGGSETRDALTEGLQSLKLETYYSRYMCISVNTEGTIQIFHKNTEVSFDDSIVLNRYPSDTQFVGILFEHLNTLGIPILNQINLSYTKASEKIAQMIRFATNGIPIPATLVMRKESAPVHQELITDMHFPLICKTDGMMGKQVVKIDSWEQLLEYAENLKPLAVFMVQEYIPNTYDLRLIYAFDTYFGAIKRTAPEGSFLNNFSQGGTVEAYEASTDEIQLAQKVLEVNKLDIGGVDIIHSDRGPLILEVNQGPGVDGFQSVHTEEKILTRIAKLIEQKFTK